MTVKVHRSVSGITIGHIQVFVHAYYMTHVPGVILPIKNI